MAQGLLAYSDTLNNGGHRSKDLKITIEKVENGYIFKLYGQKEVPNTKTPEQYWERWESFEATFVYGDLQEGLKECEGFFEAMEKILTKKVEGRKKK